MNIGPLLLAVGSLAVITLLALGIARRINLGSIVALLLVGVLLGQHSPWPVFTDHVEALRGVGEIGVMLLLFALGLDIQPRKLWSMRGLVFGLGSVQFALTVIAFVASFLLVGSIDSTQWRSGLAVALALAMSSGAIPLPILAERREENTSHGRATIAIEIFQSLLIVPVLAVCALLGTEGSGGTSGFVALDAARLTAVFTGVFLLGRYVLPWALAIIARGSGPMHFSLIVIAATFLAGWAMDSIGISMALGGFMMGVLLSTSLYAEQVKAAVTPARQVLLALFFISIGMAIDLKQLVSVAGDVLLYLPLLLTVKFIIVTGLLRLWRQPLRSAVLAGALLMPFDEVAYVIMASAHSGQLLSAHAYMIGLGAISLSFVACPLLISLAYRLSTRLVDVPQTARDVEAPPRADDRVLVLGAGAIGRAVCGLLQRADIPYLAVESSMDDFARAQRMGQTVRYGDFTDAAVLQNLDVAQARAVIVAPGEVDALQASLDSLRHFHPQVPAIAAVPFLAQRDRLRHSETTEVFALMPEGTMRFGHSILVRLGIAPDEATELVSSLAARDFAALRALGQ